MRCGFVSIRKNLSQQALTVCRLSECTLVSMKRIQIKTKILTYNIRKLAMYHIMVRKINIPYYAT